MVTPVKPIESFGASSQRALEEFRLNYNTALASVPMVWADKIGDLLSGDSLKDTYPIAIDVIKYRELAGQNAEAVTTLVKDITVIKREFAAAAEVELRRLKRGDFAYVKSWAEKPGRMAVARQFLRNETIAALIATGGTAATCKLDDAAFFSTSHKVNPFDPTITFDGSATWSNFETSATPLNAANLTAQKLALKRVPGPDGRELGQECIGILVPTVLDDIAYELISVQDLILSGALAGGGDGTMGTVRNPHFKSGLEKHRGPELPGSGADADWYLIGSAARDYGLFPWVFCEDASEELRTWDENSDYYKAHSRIKVESRVLCEAAFLFPHAIRKVSGS